MDVEQMNRCADGNHALFAATEATRGRFPGAESQCECGAVRPLSCLPLTDAEECARSWGDLANGSAREDGRDG